MIPTPARRRALAAYLLLAAATPVLAQAPSATPDPVTVSGVLTDAVTGEALLYATVAVDGTPLGTTTNEYGFYSLDLPRGRASTLAYSYVGYATQFRPVVPQGPLRLSVALAPAGQQLGEVEVVASRAAAGAEEVRSTQTSVVNLPVAQTRSLPALGGEVDVLKVVQLLPGVSRGAEGGTAMFVRGGDADQNLVLLDEAVVYNVGHLFGFFSVFNPDALKDVTLVKGGFPAQYGGRLSSVLDVRMKDGNNRGVQLEGGIGLLSSRLTLEVPLVRDRAALLVSGRRTYLDQVLGLVGADVPYYFYDLNAKLNYRLSERDQLFASSYLGDDVLAFAEDDVAGGDDDEGDGGAPPADSTDLSDGIDLDFDFGFQLGNFTQTVRWNHLYSDKLFSNVSLIHTRFDYDIRGRVGDNAVLVGSAIRDYAAKADFTYYATNALEVRYGAAVTLHEFRPNILSARGEIARFIDDRAGPRLSTVEPAAYANAEYRPPGPWAFSGGLRVSGVTADGAVYGGLEPRATATRLLGADGLSSVKLSYARMRQYLHRVSSSSIALPTDLWYPVSARVRPQTADQVAAAYTRAFAGPALTLTVEAYGKRMRNLIEYREGANLILNDNFEDQLLQGAGTAWGAELLLRRQTGRLTGWVAYALGYARRQFDGLNGGEAYFARYDRRHTLALVGAYDLTPRLTFSAVWEYATGSRFTPVVAQYLYPNASLTEIGLVPVYTSRNALRLSAAHRLDVNLVIRNKPTKRFRSEWHLGAYNLYNRASPYTTRVRLDPATGRLRYEQPGLFGFVPSVAYNFSFQARRS